MMANIVPRVTWMQQSRPQSTVAGHVILPLYGGVSLAVRLRKLSYAANPMFEAEAVGSVAGPRSDAIGDCNRMMQK